MRRPPVRSRPTTLDREHAAPEGTADGTVAAPVRAAHPAVPDRVDRAVPSWAVRTLVTGAALLVFAGVGWLVFWFLLRVPLVTVTIAVALLLAALLQPVTRLLHRMGLPWALTALLSVLLLLAVLAGVGSLVGFRAAARLRDLTQPLAAGIDRVRVWLIEGPLGLDPQQVTDIRNAVVGQLYQLTPGPSALAQMALSLLAAVLLAVFLLFFLLKDGARMWTWAMSWVPDRRREQVDGAGHSAWEALSQYVHAVVVVALIDAVAIGAGLLVLGVPLWVSLTLLTFLGAFVPLIGATVSGAVAVLVTLVTNGLTDAIIVLVIVLVVQQVEGNLLQPLIVGRTLHLHPVAVIVAVTVGTLLWGLPGSLLATPFVAVTHRVADHLRQHPARPAEQSDIEPAVAPVDHADPVTVSSATSAGAVDDLRPGDPPRPT